MSSANDKPQKTQPSEQPGFWTVVFSVLASFFGVQSGKRRARDFTHGRPLAYIVAGLILTTIFVLVLFTVVRLVLRAAGA